MDSYALPIEVYGAKPLEDWLKRWKYVVSNGQSLQNVDSKSCGHYALMFLKAKARGYSMSDFLSQFSKHDYVTNDHVVGQMLKSLIADETAWNRVCKLAFEQSNQIKDACCAWWWSVMNRCREKFQNTYSFEYVDRGSLG